LDFSNGSARFGVGCVETTNFRTGAAMDLLFLSTASELALQGVFSHAFSHPSPHILPHIMEAAVKRMNISIVFH
jgi:hypothetical protein